MKRYFIDGDTAERWSTLREVREHVEFHAGKDLQGYNGLAVCSYDDKTEETRCHAIIKIHGRRVIFSRP